MRSIGSTTTERRLTFVTSALSLLPVGAAGAFALVLALNIRRLTAVLTWNADFVSPMVLAERLGTGHGPNEVIFGTYAPLTTLWFNVLTRHLPAHRALWKLAPLMFAVLGLAALGWAVWRAAGPWPAMIMVAVGFCGSTPVLTTFLPQANHGPAYVMACLLASFLVFVSTRAPRPLVVASAGVMGLLAGLNIASDPLLLLVGVVPFLGAALLVAARRGFRSMRHVVVLAAGVTGIALVVAAVMGRVDRALGYAVLGVSGKDNPLALASPSQFRANLHRLVDNVGAIFNADVGRGLDLATPARVILAGLTVVGFGASLALLVRSMRSRPPSPGVGSTVEAASEGSALVLLQAYWGLVTCCLLLGLVLSRLAAVNSARSLGYTTPLLLAVAVAGPVAARRSRQWRAVVGVGAALFCVLSLVSVAQRDIAKGYRPFAFTRDGDQMLRVLEAQGLHRGYSSYGSASPLTFRSGGRIQVAPVILCAPEPDRLTLCGFPANRVKAWYLPRPGPSFVISDTSQTWPVPLPPPAELGAPSGVLTVGSQTVFVYPYDVASRFGPTG